jgi:L-iditol 2-dehydrogenase
VIDAREYSAEKLKDFNDNRLADAVIVCAAAKQAINDALCSVYRKGTVLFFAAPEFDINIPSQRFWRDEITVTFSYGAAPDDIRQAIYLIEGGAISVGQMVTHSVPFSAIQQGFKIVSEARDSLKVVVVPDNNEPGSAR